MVPYNILFFESTNEGKTADYFIRVAHLLDRFDPNTEFIEELRNTVERIIYKLQELQMKM